MKSKTCKGCIFIKKYSEMSDGNKEKYFCTNNKEFDTIEKGESIHPFKILNLNDIECNGYKKLKEVEK